MKEVESSFLQINELEGRDLSKVIKRLAFLVDTTGRAVKVDFFKQSFLCS